VAFFSHSHPLGDFVSGTPNFSNSYAHRLIDQGYWETTEHLQHLAFYKTVDDNGHPAVIKV
jgi:hypothetical protein